MHPRGKDKGFATTLTRPASVAFAVNLLCRGCWLLDDSALRPLQNGFGPCSHPFALVIWRLRLCSQSRSESGTRRSGETILKPVSLVASLTFVLVGFRLDAENGDDHDDDDDGGGGEGDDEPGLAIERLRLEVAVLQVHLGWRLHLKTLL